MAKVGGNDVEGHGRRRRRRLVWLRTRAGLWRFIDVVVPATRDGTYRARVARGELFRALHAGGVDGVSVRWRADGWVGEIRVLRSGEWVGVWEDGLRDDEGAAGGPSGGTPDARRQARDILQDFDDILDAEELEAFPASFVVREAGPGWIVELSRGSSSEGT